MRNRLSWLILISVIAVFLVSCNSDGNNGSLGGSEVLIRNLTIGNIPIQVGQTHNIPLSQVTSMRFELNRAVSEQSLAQVFDFEILISNLDEGTTYRLTTCNMAENGNLVWIDGYDGRVVEFRALHPLGTIVAGGQPFSIGSPGNLLKVRVVYLIGQSADGKHWSYTDDTFYIVWTDSDQS